MFNLNWCRNICHEGRDDGTISGKVTKLKPEESVPLTTYFYKALHVNKTIDPDKVAINCHDRTFTFAELDGFSSALAEVLKGKLGTKASNQNPEKELIIGVSLSASEKLIAAIFGILKTGAAYLPLDPMLPEEILLAIIDKFRPIILIGGENEPLLTKYNVESFTQKTILISLEDIWLEMNLSQMSMATRMKSEAKISKLYLVEPFPQQKESEVYPLDRPAVVIQTTDISKDPRGVRISHASILNQIFWSWREIPFDKNGSSCLNMSVSTIWAVGQIFAPLLKGVTLHVFPKKESIEIDTFVRKIGEKKISRIYLVPVVLRDFLNECYNIEHHELQHLLRHLLHVIIQGDILPYNLAHLFFSVFPSHKTLTKTFGCAELSGDVLCETFRSANDVEMKTFHRRMTFGKCVDNARIHIIGSGLELMEEWNQGEICVSGIPVSLGYVKMNYYAIEHTFITNPHKESADHPTLFRTGWCGRMVRCEDERLRLYIEGRGDEIIRHQGFEFNIEDVRTIVNSLPSVRFLETIVFHPGKLDQTVVAFVVPRESKTILTPAELEFQLRSKLPEFMIPELKIIKILPFVHNTGRIDQAELFYTYQLDREPNIENWTYLKMQNEEMYKAAQTLFLGMYKFCYSSVKMCIANMDVSIFDLGVTSLNIVALNCYLVSQGFDIHLREMLVNMPIHDLITLMVEHKTDNGKSKSRSSTLTVLTMEAKEGFTVKLLDHARSKEAFRVVATAYTEKGELESYNMVRPHEYHDFLAYYINAYKEQSICFYITQKPYEEVVAVCIAHDYFTDFNIKMNAALTYVIDIQQEIKGVNLAKFPHKRNKILELFIMATSQNMTSNENVQLVLLMFGELTNFAERENYTHIYVNSTNQLIRDLCINIFGYTVIDELPVREFIEKDGFRPYRLAPSVICMTSLCCRLATGLEQQAASDHEHGDSHSRDHDHHHHREKSI